MYPATVIDVNGNGTVSVMLDDNEIIDIETSQPVNMGDRIMVSPDDISQGKSYLDMPEEDDEERPSFDW